MFKLEIENESTDCVLLIGKHKEAFIKIVETLKSKKDPIRFKEITEQVKIDNRIISTVPKLMESWNGRANTKI